jgi:23S rRNA (pseudouridine1915-N3)-methyltransferase
MLKVDLIAVGKLKKGPLFDLQEEYRERIRWPLTIHEVESKLTDPKQQQAEEHKLVLDKIPPSSFLIVLDERGDGLRSLDFAKTLGKIRDGGDTHFTFLIGGANGFSDDIRQKSHLLLSFGQQTWPHMMVRVMLLEQIYRAQQIMAGHPYHREG